MVKWFIYIRSEYRDSLVLNLWDIKALSIRVFLNRTNQCRRKFKWKMCLEICSLIGNHRITYRVRLIKRIRSRRLDHLLIDIGCCLRFILFIGFSSCYKFFFELFDYFFFLLTHSSSEHICLTQWKPCHCLHQKHQLLLIYRNSIGQTHNRREIFDQFSIFFFSNFSSILFCKFSS